MWISDAAGHWRIKEMGIGIFFNSLGFEHWWDEMMGISTSKRWRYLISQNEEIKITGDVTNEIADLTVKSQCIVSLVARFNLQIFWGFPPFHHPFCFVTNLCRLYSLAPECALRLWVMASAISQTRGARINNCCVTTGFTVYIYIHIQKLVKHNDTWNFPHEYNILYI